MKVLVFHNPSKSLGFPVVANTQEEGVKLLIESLKEYAKDEHYAPYFRQQLLDWAEEWSKVSGDNLLEGWSVREYTEQGWMIEY